MATGQLDNVLQHLRQATLGHDSVGWSDGELLDCFIRQQDEMAFAALVRRHGPMVLGVCRRVLRNEADAEDAFQATFLVLVRKAATIRVRGTMGNWLYGVAYNTALKARAMNARRRVKESEARGMVKPEESDEHREQMHTLLDQELHGLPDKYRVPIVLCDLEGKTRKEAARQLHLAEGTVASRLARARVLLAKRLTRNGLTLSGGTLAVLLSQGTASGSVPAALVLSTTRAATLFTAGAVAKAGGISANVAALTESVVQTMFLTRLKIVTTLLLVSLFITGTLLLAAVAPDDRATGFQAKQGDAEFPQPGGPGQLADKPKGKAKARSCIILWMSGGPSQLDTFDVKPEAPAEIRGPFKAINTTVKGIQISEHLPRLAKLTNHLAIIRSLTHKEGDHVRGTVLMRTGYSPDGQADYPTLGCVLAKELGESRPDLPHYITIAPLALPGWKSKDPGFLGPEFAPLKVGDRAVVVAPVTPDKSLLLPPVADFEALAKGKGEKWRKAVEKAFDLDAEKPAVRDAYGRNLFGQGCLLARRLVEQGVPVVEVTLPGWDTHANNFDAVKNLSETLDPAWATLLSDLKKRDLLDSTLVLWMGEFGRTPKINASLGRDHWPAGFSVVLSGGGIKGGQVIGRTSKDGFKVEERPVTPPELLATVYQIHGIDFTKQYVSNTGQPVRLVAKGTKAVAEALP